METSEVTTHAVLDEMERTGGGYVKALAAAYYKADPANRELLQPALDKYWEDYARRVEKRKESIRA